ncbi:hypothetical protein ACWCP6_15425 [Streptomyces sp. NPDC002004]
MRPRPLRSLLPGSVFSGFSRARGSRPSGSSPAPGPRATFPASASSAPGSLTLGALAAAGVVAGVVGLSSAAGAAPYPPAPQASPTCAALGGPGGSAGPGFPLTARIRGGPGVYRAGDGFQGWEIDLANSTDVTCDRIHPVVVFVDRSRQLLPAQVRMEFNDGSRWRPVELDRTDRDETIAVFDDGFSGFAVGPRKTVTVKVRLALTADARANAVVAEAAVVQRRGDDGDWVGESQEYPFEVEAASGGRSTEPVLPSGSAQPTAQPDRPGRSQQPEPSPSVPARPTTGSTPGVGTGTPAEPSADGGRPRGGHHAHHGDRGGGPEHGDDDEREHGGGREHGTDRDRGSGNDRDGEHGHRAPELAETGRRGTLLALGAAAGVMVLGGAALLALARRPR